MIDCLCDGDSSVVLSLGVVSSGVRVPSRRGSGSRQGGPGGQQVWRFIKQSPQFPLYVKRLFATDTN